MENKGIRVHKPDSVLGYHLSWPLDYSKGSMLPTRSHGQEDLNGYLHGIAPDRVYPASKGYPWSGKLLPYLFTLAWALNEPSAVCFLWHFPSCINYMPGISPVSFLAVSGLSSPLPGAIAYTLIPKYKNNSFKLSRQDFFGCFYKKNQLLYNLFLIDR